MEEIKDLIRGFTGAITSRLDDHDLLIELRGMQQNTLNQVNSLVAEIPKRYVTADQFEPVKKLVYGLASLILMGVMGAVISLVLRR